MTINPLQDTQREASEAWSTIIIPKLTCWGRIDLLAVRGVIRLVLMLQ